MRVLRMRTGVLARMPARFSTMVEVVELVRFQERPGDLSFYRLQRRAVPRGVRMPGLLYICTVSLSRLSAEIMHVRSRRVIQCVYNQQKRAR